MYMSVKEKHILQNVGSIRNFRIIQYQICKKPWSTPHSNPSFEGSLGRFWDTQLRNRGSGKRIQIFNIQPMPYLREGNGTPLQYSCLENPMEGAAWWAAVMGLLGVGHEWATSLSLFTFMHWRRKWQPTPVFLPGESHGRRNLVGCHLWGRRVGHDWSDLAAEACPFYHPISFILT